MNAYNYQEIMDQISNLRPWQVVAASCSCAEKVAPIVRSLALPETWSNAKKCLEFSWRSCVDTEPSSEDGERLLRELVLSPELTCEYPDSLVYLAARSLNLFRYAITAAMANSINEKAENVGFDLVLEIADSFDTTISEYPDLLSSNVRIEMAEEESQSSLIATLCEVDFPTPEIIESLRKQSQVVSELFSKSLPTYCYAFTRALIRNEMPRP